MDPILTYGDVGIMKLVVALGLGWGVAHLFLRGFSAAQEVKPPAPQVSHETKTEADSAQIPSPDETETLETGKSFIFKDK